MTNYTNGLDALQVLAQTNEGASNNNAKFTLLNTGTSFKVKVLGKEAIQMAYVYSIFKKVNSFVAKNPAIRNGKGYIEGNLSPWDKAAEYYRKQSKQFQDAASQEAYKYAGKPRFAFAFYDIVNAETIIVDLSKVQALAVIGAINKYEKKIGKLAFELSKEGTSTNTKVSLTPIIDMEDDLTDKERENFEKGPDSESFDHSIFNGIWYEQDENQMVQLLKQAGFDVNLIGYGDAKTLEEKASDEVAKGGEISEDDLPF